MEEQGLTVGAGMDRGSKDWVWELGWQKRDGGWRNRNGGCRSRNGGGVPGMADGCQGWVVGGRGQAQAAHRDIRVTSSAG